MRGLGALLALLCAAAALVPAAPAAGEEATWAQETVGWWLLGTGPRERSIEIAFVTGGCDRGARVQTAESGEDVTVSVTTERPQGGQLVCPALARISTQAIALGRPLAGRRLRGLWAPGPAPMLNPWTPRLVGLAPADARRLLGSILGPAGLREHVRRVIVSSGLARVLAQYPEPHAALPRDQVLRILIGTPRNRAFHAGPSGST